MYAYLSGTIKSLSKEFLSLDIQGIGYQIFAPSNILEDISILNTKKLFYTSFIIREDSMRLFGFLDEKEKILFEKLISISGVGPKTALAIISSASEIHFAQSIQEKNIKNLTKIPGIGKKTAERMILELFDSLDFEPIPKSNNAIDAIKALVGLGIKKHIASKKVDRVVKESKENLSTAKIISLSLSTNIG